MSFKYDFNKKGTKEYKYQMLIRRAKELIDEYKEIQIKLTIRQIYYRLVVNKEIPNNRSQYVYYDDVLTDYRKQNLIFADIFMDDARPKIKESYINYPIRTYSESIKAQINYVKRGYPYFSWNENLLQDKLNVILLEKQALQKLFELGITPNTLLIVARGINSFSQMNTLSKLLKNEERELKLYCFTDFDDTGLFIQENFIYQMKEYLHIKFDTIERIALTQDIIENLNLPIDPTAKTTKQEKSTHKDYNLPYFVELDAIEPKMLIDLVKKTCEQNYNQELFESIDKALKIRNRRLKKAYFRELRKIDLSKL